MFSYIYKPDSVPISPTEGGCKIEYSDLASELSQYALWLRYLIL